MSYYKVIIQERSSLTAYIKANNEAEAENRAIFDCIHARDNQDFEQKAISIEQIRKKIYRKD